MHEGEEEVLRFLAQHGWADGRRERLAGDASQRRYERLRGDDATAILMIAPASAGENIRPFVDVARYLRSIGLHAPEIVAIDAAAGLLILEDLGDDLFARVVQTQPDLETSLYEAAVDVLVELHRHSPPHFVAPFDSAALTSVATAAWKWYGPDKDSRRFSETIAPLLRATHGLTDVLILRDYHAENLIWLPGNAGLARVGLLDFQDALAGHRAYDLVSLLEDARRDVPPGLRRKIVERYLSASGLPEVAFRRALAVLGAQRSLRILGVFARLSLRDGKRQYLRLLPRVWTHLMHALSHPDLVELQACVLSDLPPPDPVHLARLENACSPTP